MTVTITYFVHGTTTDNEEGRATGWNHGELSPLGVQQSITLRDQLTDEFAVVFCSDLSRAVESARLTFGEMDVEIIKDDRLRECNYGRLNGKKETDGVKEHHLSEPFPDGESYEAVEARIRGFLEDIKQRFDGKHIAIVAHQAPQLALDVITKGISWEQAFAEDWRKQKAWQPGWRYEY